MTTTNCPMTFHSIVKFFFACIIFCFAGTVHAEEEFPELPSPPRLVNDYAGFLKPGEVNALEQKLDAYNDSTSTQIVVVTRENIGDYEPSDYAQRLAQKWGVGQQGKNNGLLILAVKEPHGFFIATGYGMEGTLPDATLKRLFEEIIKPSFRAQNYYGGLDQVTDAIIQLMSGTYQADAKGGKASGNKAIFIFVLLVVLLAILSGLSKRGGGGSGGGGFLAGALLGSLGSGGFSSRGGYSGGSGGGFGGFGGGSFGGGGAGGSW
ncbi:MAG: hypothetical protein JWM14_45 [Chitinophagaceae bacterium]|nr:hypothetical protein [Chitinophagaceae bacterium]